VFLLPGRRAQHQQRHPLPLPGGDVPDRVADLRYRTQVMMGVEQRLEAYFLVYRDRTQGDVMQVQAQRPPSELGVQFDADRRKWSDP
jgi:hypothetical protein